jgi:hypothetical protein
MTHQEIEKRINLLRMKLTGDLHKDAVIREEIHKLELQLKGVERITLKSPRGCSSCGS